MELLENIRRLSDIPGVSGWEDAVREEILLQIKDVCQCHTDHLGNLIAFKKGRQAPVNKLLFSAHMDEVGFIITHIEESGLLRFACIGGIDRRVILGRAVEVGEARLPGVIGAKAVHMQTDKEKAESIPPDKLFIDIGATTRGEAEQEVALGDRVIFSGDFFRLGESMISGRAFDDRAGCALMIDLIQSELEYDCYFSFTVQEETGCTGAIPAAYGVNPDIAIAVETTTASDIAGVEASRQVCALGKGGVLSFMDRGTVYDHKLYSMAMEQAGKHGIPCQAKEGVFGGNEARSIQVAQTGTRMLAVSLPCRYLHTAHNVLHVDDIESTGRLLKLLASALAQV